MLFCVIPRDRRQNIIASFIFLACLTKRSSVTYSYDRQSLNSPLPTSNFHRYQTHWEIIVYAESYINSSPVVTTLSLTERLSASEGEFSAWGYLIQ
jgi:hypothetical protein